MDVANVKTCTKCKLELSVSEFGKQQGGKFGVRADCKPCVRAKAKIRRLTNPEKNKARTKCWREANPERVIANTAKYIEANHERVKAAAAKWRSANLEKAQANNKEWKKNNPEKALADKAKTLIVANSNLKRSDIPDSLIQMKMEALKTKRLARQLKNQLKEQL